jgi:hypothetical protein
MGKKRSDSRSASALPNHLTIEIKGSPISRQGDGIYVNEIKLGRPCDLFSKGFT